jgi:hypothetical protein
MGEDWLIGACCLMAILAVFKLYRGVNQFYQLISLIICISIKRQNEINTEKWTELLTITVVFIKL